MAAGTSLTEVQLPPNTSTKDRFLQKIARSPTSARRHKAIPSQGSDTLSDSLNSTVTQTHGALNSQRHLPRPGFQRQISAPDAAVLHLPHTEAIEPKHHSDATGDTVQQARAMLSRNTPSATGLSSSFTSVSGKSPAQANMVSAPLVSEYYVPPTGTAVNGHHPAVNYMYQQLYELCQRRIATLQYMRKAHEGKIFWFNTVHISKGDISRLPSYTPNRLSRRATNFFLLGISLPNVLDVHQLPPPGSSAQACASVAQDYLKSLNILLTEFETYQEKHPTDGSHVGSLSRARLPSMFKRSGTTSRPRKSSGAPSVEIGAQISPPAVPDTPHHPMHHSSHASMDTTSSMPVSSSFNSVSSAQTLISSASFGGGMPSTNFSAAATFPAPGPPDAPNSSLLPSEAIYSHLLTPPLPFAPDFYTVFATLCDVLIDTYQRLLQMITGPAACTATISELFGRTDAKIRKVMVAGIIRDFEHAARENAKKELNGVQKIVLGGLMG